MSARIRAFLIHLFVSAFVILSLIAYVRWVWYPDGLFWLEGVTDPLTVLFSVDVVLGPLLTLILFVPGKRGLKFDMGMVVVLQLAALVYGSLVLWQARPVAVAFNGNAFGVARAYEMPDATLPEWAKPASPFGGSAMVFAEQTNDPDFILNVLMGAQPDVHLLPEQYRPLADRMERLQETAYLMPALAESEPFKQAWDAVVGVPLTADAPYLVFPLYGRVLDGAAVLHAEDASYVAFLDVDVTGIDGASPRLQAAEGSEATPAAMEGVSDESARDDSATEESLPPARDADGA